MSTGSSDNQTLSFLAKRFREAGVRIQSKLGQNFLVDLNLLRLLVQTADLGPRDVVLEVGTGTGSLTAHLAEGAGNVVTVELDRQMHQLASEELVGRENVTMLHTDALHGKHRLNPDVLGAIARLLKSDHDRRFKLIANLPYQIATPLVSNLLELDRPPELMVITIQQELADRMAAKPGTRDYGALSVWIQSQCHVEIVRTLPPTVFWPRPKVHSAIVRIELDAERRERIANRTFFHDTVRRLFLHRRKYLRSGLVASFSGELDKPAVDEILAEVGFSADARAEQLDYPSFLVLAEAIGAKLAG